MNEQMSQKLGMRMFDMYSIDLSAGVYAYTVCRWNILFSMQCCNEHGQKELVADIVVIIFLLSGIPS